MQWGVDLDAGKTGFLNAYEVVLKLNLLNNGTKSTTGDGVWGELVLKTDGDSFVGWKNTANSDNVSNADQGMMGDGHVLGLKVYVDTAKVHFGPAYIGIKSGDTQTGELKMDAAIRSSDDNQAKWLENVGPDKFSQGIVAGFDHDMFNIAVDLRSYYDANQYSDSYAVAAEGEFTGVENLSVKAGVSYNFSDKHYADAAKDESKDLDNVLGYSASAGYKLALNDTYYIRPQVGFTGRTSFKDDDSTATDNMAIAAGLLFGWGDIGIDDNAGVYYLDDDMAKKVSPGVGVVAYIPLPVINTTKDGKMTTSSPYAARIMPSFFSGEIVPNLTAAAYADIGIMQDQTVKDDKGNEFKIPSKNKDMAFAVAMGAKYAIPVGEMTVTPNLGIRFANASYRDNIGGNLPKEKDDGVFNNLGVQKQDSEGLYDGNSMNLKAGVDVTGLIDNTTLSVIYESRNLLNSTDYTDPANPEKLGTLNFKAKIAL